DLAGERPVQRRGEVGQEHRYLPADGPQRHEEIVTDRHQPKRPADTGLLPERLEQPGEILGERRWQDVRLPGIVLFAVDDDGNVVAAGVRHRHSIGGVARNEMLSDPSPPCPAKPRVGAAATSYMPDIITYGNRSNGPSPIVQITTCGLAGE